MTNTAWHHKEDEKGYNPTEDPQKKKKELDEENPKPPEASDINSKVDSMMEEVIKTLNKGKGKGDLPTKHK